MPAADCDKDKRHIYENKYTCKVCEDYTIPNADQTKCWRRKCKPNEFTTKDGECKPCDEKSMQVPDVIDGFATECKVCEPFTKPNADRSACEKPATCKDD